MASKITDIQNIDDVFAEVKLVFSLMYPEEKFDMFEKAFIDIVHLFAGEYDGYKACNTPFHDLQHTLDCLLAMIRLLHGAHIENVRFTPEETELGLISAIMHDTGYIQTIDDHTGSGAKYTLVHVKRSAEFLRKYFEDNQYSDDAKCFCMSCINYTGIGTEIDNIQGGGDTLDIMGQMLGTADLVGQMADHAYLEKLLYLAEEFKEGKVPGYETEDELLRKTKDFYLSSRKRLKNEYGGVVKYMTSHFKHRWDINKNVYLESIQNQINYLEYVICEYPNGYQKHLKRNGISEAFLEKKSQRTGL